MSTGPAPPPELRPRRATRTPGSKRSSIRLSGAPPPITIMSLPKDMRLGEPRRRDRPDELEETADKPAVKKPASPSHGASAFTLEDGDGEEEIFINRHAETEGVAPSPPNVPVLSSKVQVRTSSLGMPQRSPDSPKYRGRFPPMKSDRRDSLLGRTGVSNSPPSSPAHSHGLSGSFREPSGLSIAQTPVEYDTDSEDDSPFPPPISSSDQVSYQRKAQPTMHLRHKQNAQNVPLVNATSARKMLAGIRERRMAQERSQNTPTTPKATLRSLESSSPIMGVTVSEPKSSGIYRLDRGGVLVPTSKGPIQFGIPPETIKDTLALGIEVPQVYVVPRDRFDTVAGLNMCEIEFPGYYQFFLRNRTLTLVSSAEAEKSLKNLMKEILEGPPETHLYTNDECLDEESRPDHVKEMAYFVRPRNGRSINVDSLFNFIRFEPVNNMTSDSVFPDTSLGDDTDNIVAKARINENVEIHETERGWIVYDKGEEIAKVEFWLASTVPPQFPLGMVLPTKTFVPPTLGITVLGSSHGFDAKQSTSGFVLWMHGKGIMVDPPPNATDLLKRGGISPRWISAIILTHCHADHDAGTFQKILVEGRVTLMTTKTIMASFLRKYSKISGFTEAFLCRLFEPRVVKIGEDVFYGGGILRFHYAFHALPCIGFQCFVAGKSVAYSADTLYEPTMLHDLCEEGVLSPGRRDGLLAFPFETADLVIHEAGIPPIHTPVEVLKALSENARERLYVIHIAEAAAESSGLRLARAGTEHTIRVVEGEAHAYALDVLTNSELFFPHLASVHKFGRGIVSAAQERMQYMDYDNPKYHDFCFLDCSNTVGLKRYITSSLPGHSRDRGSSFLNRTTFSAIERPPSATRDSDLSFSSVKRNSAGFETVHMSPNRPAHINGVRRASNSTHKSQSFASDMDEEDFTVTQVADLLRLSSRCYFKANEIISADEGKGDTGLYLVMRGFCRVEPTANDQIINDDMTQPSEGPAGTVLEPGDCFGLLIAPANRENRLLRKCVVRSLTDMEVLALDIDSIWYLLNVYPALDRRLSRMHELRALEAWRTMELNSCLRRLASFQRTQLNAVLELKEFKRGEELWTKKSGPRNAYLVAEGQLVFGEIADEMNERPFEAGALLCDFQSMVSNKRVPSTSSMSSGLGPSATAVGAAVYGAISAHVAGTSTASGEQDTSNTSSSQSTNVEPDNQPHFPLVTLIAKTDCRLYQINWRDALQFLESNPGVLVQIYHSYVVE